MLANARAARRCFAFGETCCRSRFGAADRNPCRRLKKDRFAKAAPKRLRQQVSPKAKQRRAARALASISVISVFFLSKDRDKSSTTSPEAEESYFSRIFHRAPPNSHIRSLFHHKKLANNSIFQTPPRITHESYCIRIFSRQ